MCRCCCFPTSWLTWISPEDTFANLKIHRLGFAKDVKRQYHTPTTLRLLPRLLKD